MIGSVRPGTERCHVGGGPVFIEHRDPIVDVFVVAVRLIESVPEEPEADTFANHDYSAVCRIEIRANPYRRDAVLFQQPQRELDAMRATIANVIVGDRHCRNACQL